MSEVASHRALLIGVPAYEDRAIDDLPFIEDDLTELAQALKTNGYEVDVHDPARTDRDAMDLAVETFFLDALPGQTLLIFLSGHGIHHQDTDYLVPRGASTRSSRFTERCLSLDFGGYAEHSQAGDVVVFIDACREGITVREKSPGQIMSWSEMRVRRVGERRFAYVYACTKGEAARYATTGTTTFSLFSRALSTLITAETGPSTLAEVREGLQATLAELCSEHGFPLQHVRVGTETDTEFTVVPRPERAAAELVPGEHPWIGLVRDHPAWPLVADGPGAALLQDATAALVQHLADLDTADARLLAADPWRSPGLAERVTERVGWLLVNMLNAGKLTLSPAEAALLVAVPFLHTAYGDRAAARALRAEPLRLEPVRLRQGSVAGPDAESGPGAESDAGPERRPGAGAESDAGPERRPGAGAESAAGPERRPGAGAESDAGPEPVAERSEDRASYEQFVAGHDRLVRRAARAAEMGDEAGAAGIAWWLFHRWAARRPGTGQGGPAAHDGPLDELLGPVAGAASGLVAEVFAPEPLLVLLRSLVSSPDLAAERPVRQLAGSSGVEQPVRDQLLLALLTVAHRMAIDPAALPDVVVDHIGIRYSVDLPDLHRTVERARWDPRGRSRVLHAVCTHPAVGLALEQLASSVDRVLGAIDVLAGSVPQLKPLEDLPAHATADQVVAAVTAGGNRAYESTDLRFRLADDRIQELLMGEQLYGDPALAIRELYQNALDACRYRDARTRYLRAKGRYPDDGWRGRIAFTQGVDDEGRAYIDCADNGIGMGERELRDTFAHAGMRFADLPEYLEEQAGWRTEGIEVHPNSRFGIGVLSYFMLADDVRVTTCRLDRDGHPGRRLRVDIAGPGALFKVEDEGRAFEAGTTVRLYVRDAARAPSCVDLLRRLLWIAEFEVTASGIRQGDGDGEEDSLRWEPGVLSEMCPLGADDPASALAQREPGVRWTGTPDPAVWWCQGEGALLADGLWVGQDLFGAVVNLTGRYAPQLSVNRASCLSYDRKHVARLLCAAIGVVVEPACGIADQAWLTSLWVREREVAERIADAVFADDRRMWGFEGFEGRAFAVGCFLGDAAVFQRKAAFSWPVLRDDEVLKIPGPVVEWRIRAWVKAGAFPGLSLRAPAGVLTARPGDIHYLAAVVDAVGFDRPAGYGRERGPLGVAWRRESILRGAGHVMVTAARLGVSPGRVARRMTELGIGPAVPLPAAVGPEDGTLLSHDLDVARSPLGAGETVPLGHALMGARRTGLPLREVGRRFGLLGHAVDGDLDAAVPDDEELVLTGDQLGGWHWFTTAEPLGPQDLLRVARASGRRPPDVAHRLRELGYRIAEGFVIPAEARADDVDLLVSDEDNGRWRSPGVTVFARQVAACGTRTGRDSAYVRARLEEFGFRVQGPPARLDRADPTDQLLASRILDGRPPWLPYERTVPAGHLIRAFQMRGIPVRQAAERLERLGYVVPPLDGIPEEPLPGDAELFDALRGRERMELSEVVRHALRTSAGPAAIARRAGELGLLPPGVRVDAETAESGDDEVFPMARYDLGTRVDNLRPVPLGQVLDRARELGRAPADVARRLAHYGCRLPARTPVPDDVRDDDVDLLRGRAAYTWLDAEEPVSLAHILHVAAAIRRHPAEVAVRLGELGYQLPDDIIFEPAPAAPPDALMDP